MNLFDYGVPAIMIVIGLIYFMATPRYRKSSGFKTEQTLRGKEQWNYGHKMIGLLFIFYGVVSGMAHLGLASSGIVINRYAIVILYCIELGSTIPLMNLAIEKKFGKDEELERMHAQRREMQEEYRKKHDAEVEKKKAAREKEQKKKKMLKAQQKIAKQRKKERGR